MTENGAFLEATINREHSNLLNIITHYVVKMRLSMPHEARALASEILSETVIEALHNAHKYDPSRRPVPWLLGIACNRIRKRLDEVNRRKQNEIPVRDLYPATQADQSDDELFERLAGFVRDANSSERSERLEEWLAPLTPDERRIIELAIFHGLDGKTVAQRMGISAGAARVRLHRALARLRGHIKLGKGHA